MSDRPATIAPQRPAAADVQPGRVAGWRRVLGHVLAGGKGTVAIPLVIALLLILFPVIDNDAYWIREISLISVLALVSSGVNLSFGYAGEIQFGQVFMFALGAYGTMIIGLHTTGNIVFLVILGGLLAATAGAIIAAPALRIGGWSLAMASFFLVITIPDLITIFKSKTGGLNGLVDVPVPSFFGHTLGTNGIYETCVICLILWLTVFRNLVTSRFGIIFRILRQSPVLANSLGFSTFRLKLLAYTIGAFPAGVAGCLFAFILLVLTPSSFGFSLAIGVVAASILGGIESVYGAVLGAAVLQLGPENSLSFAQYAPIAYGAFLVVAAVALRNGIGGVGKLLSLRASRRLLGAAHAPATVMPGSLSAHVTELEAIDAVETPRLDGSSLGPLHGAPLVVEGVSKAYGGVKALQEVSLTAVPGEVTALIGSNGSGKTTLLNVICGYARADEGTVRFGEDTVTGLPPHRIARLDVGRTFQTPSVPTGVSAADVVASGRFQREECGLPSSILRLPRYWRTRRDDVREARELLALVGIAHLADHEAASLSLGNRRLVEVARALSARPRLLLLDEPASGLNDDEVKKLGEVISAAAQAGATVVLIEHNFGFVTTLCQTAHVLHFGKRIASGPASTIANDPSVIESYLGTSSTTAAEPAVVDEERFQVAAEHIAEEASPAADGRSVSGPIVELRDAVAGYGDLQVLRGISLDLQRGKVEVILGRNGVGKTTLLGTISGQRRLWSGSVKLDGTDLTKAQTYRRAEAGIALVQEGKRIFRERTIMENVVLGTFTQSLNRKARQQLCEEILEQFPMLKERAGETAGALSGGQQQMLAIAQALASRPRVLLLDEPSAGLAPSIVAEVFDRVRQLSVSGMTILLVEQLAEQALAIADHVTVIDGGRIAASGGPEDFHDLQELQEAYFGDRPSQ